MEISCGFGATDEAFVVACQHDRMFATNIPGGQVYAMPRRWSPWLILLYPVIGVMVAAWTYHRMVGITLDCVHLIDGGAGFALLFLGVAGLLSMSFVGLVTGLLAVMANHLLRTSATRRQISGIVPTLITCVGIGLIAIICVRLLNEATPPADYCSKFNLPMR
ncbi:hypothetical protein ACFYTS_27950 [Nocardia sp. NPDC004151]|uniref:hypothetical protein n=1 Tax=Nocardia sp. NPDC004151 TaxID=3364304 RepID=UPI0036CD4C5F